MRKVHCCLTQWFWNHHLLSALTERPPMFESGSCCGVLHSLFLYFINIFSFLVSFESFLKSRSSFRFDLRLASVMCSTSVCLDWKSQFIQTADCRTASWERKEILWDSVCVGREKSVTWEKQRTWRKRRPNHGWRPNYGLKPNGFDAGNSPVTCYSGP